MALPSQYRRYPLSLHPFTGRSQMNIGSLIVRNARHWPQNLALVCGDRRLTHSQLNNDVNRLANALLAIGINKGDRIATLLPAGAELTEVLWSASKIGAVLVPLPPAMGADRMVAFLKKAGTALVVANALAANALAPIKSKLPMAHDRYLLVDAERNGFRDYHGLKAAATPEEPEGQPAGFQDPIAWDLRRDADSLSSHAGYGFSAALLCALLSMTVGGSILFGAGLDPWAASLSAAGAAFCAGKSVFPQGSPRETDHHEDVIDREEVALAILSVFDLEGVLGLPKSTLARLSSVAVIGEVDHGHAVHLSRTFASRWCTLYIQGGLLAFLGSRDCQRKPGAIGVPWPFCDLKAVDPTGRLLPPGEIGEICAAGPPVGWALGNDPGSKTFWRPTGEMGYADEDGFIYRVAPDRRATPEPAESRI